jgi:S1-C subfamily serine protease
MNFPRRLLFALLVFTVSLVGFSAVRSQIAGYGLLDLLRGRAPGVESFTAPAASKLQLSDVSVMAQLDAEYAKLSAAVLPSVVSVNTRSYVPRYGRFGWLSVYQGQERQDGLGSGAFISKEGHIITNNHVIDGAREVWVTTNDKQTYKAKVIGVAEFRDVALLKVESDRTDFPALTFGDSDKARVGQIVFAVGNPFGLTGSVTQGIISARDRTISDGGKDYLQFDASINQGNSGGPLVNIQGEIVGVNVAIFRGDQKVQSWQGISLAIPSNEAKTVVESLLALAKGKAARPKEGFIGWQLSPYPQQILVGDGRGRIGAMVQSMFEGSPAAEIGLQAGDVVLAFNDKPTPTPEALAEMSAALKPGTPFKLQVWREGQVGEVTGTVAEAPQ